MLNRTDLGVLSVTGKDAGAFLHNQLTQGILTLDVGAATFAALCQPKGRVMALFLVLAEDDGFRLLCRAELADGLVTYLSRFIFRDQVSINRENDVRVVARTESGGGGFTPLPGLTYGLAEGAASGSEEAEDAFRARELEAGVAWLEETTTEQFLPQMLGHEAIGALSFRKGCFPGQEIIARTRYLGALKRHPWSGRVSERLPVEPMDDVVLSGEGQEARGVLVDQARHEDGSWQVLVVARRPAAIEVDAVAAGDQRLTANGAWLNAAVEQAREAAAGANPTEG